MPFLTSVATPQQVVSEPVQQLLAEAVDLTGDRLARLTERVRVGEWSAYIGQLDREGAPAGVIVVECYGDDLTIQALAVDPGHRHRGLGRHLVETLHEHLGRRRLVAETDEAAVGFYRALGFAVEDLGERYPGVTRFRCVLTPT